MTTVDDARASREAAEAAGQGHVFRFWDSLDDAERSHLLGELAAVDYGLVTELGGLAGADAAEGSPAFEPPDVFPLERDPARAREAVEATERGEALLASGRVGYLLVAGGQGSRLGLDGPKGAFEVGPLSGRTLFELFARRLHAVRDRYGVATPWYVMTSPANDATTRAFFARHDHFGLPAEDITFFPQAMLPALDEQGRILLADRHRLFLAPNGHGGVLEAMATSGALAAALERGVETLSYFQVDNPLARPADPLFLGLHAACGAGMSSKVVSKRDAGEKVGVLGRVDGRMACIEYSDLPAELREAVGDDGRLVFGAGNIAVHALQAGFVRELTDGGLQLPWHVAKKSVRVVDDAGRPSEQVGFKFETFVFDALGRSRTSATLEVDRAEEFSPVKNAEGEDSPRTSRRDLCALHASWVRRSGGALPADDAETGVPLVEVDPRLAETAEGFAASEASPREVSGGHLYESGRG